MNFEEFIKEMQKRGTIVAGMDACPCADCVARREKFGAKPLDIIPEESDDPIQEANRKMAIKRMELGMRRIKQTQRKNKNKKKKKKEE